MSNPHEKVAVPPPAHKPLAPDFNFALAGRRIRERRLKFRLSTKKLSQLAGVARQTVVRIEMGMPCTAMSLHRIRHALLLFTDQLRRPDREETKFALHRALNSRWTVSIPKGSYQKHVIDDDLIHVNDPAERKRLGGLGLQPFFTAVLDSELPDGTMGQALMELHKPSWVDAHFGNEFVYCLRGPVQITVDGTPCILDVGDSITFDANMPHQYEPAFEVKDDPALILVVVTMKPHEKRSRPETPK